jgi:hypothetical protein
MAPWRGGEAAVAAVKPPGGAAFSSPPVEGPAQERRGPPPTPNPLITILLRDTGHRQAAPLCNRAGLRAAEAKEEARTSLNKLFVQHFQKNVGKCMLKKILVQHFLKLVKKLV